MQERSMGFIVWASGICAGAGVISSFVRNIEWLFIVFVAITVLAFGALVSSGYPSTREWIVTRASRRKQYILQLPVSTIWNHWRYTSNGFESGQMMTTLQKSPSLPGTPMAGEEKYSSIKIGVIIACDPLGSVPGTSQLRDEFIVFLRHAPISTFMTEVLSEYIGGAWEIASSNGRLSNAAVFTPHDQHNYLAWALLILREDDNPSFGSDPRYAELIVQVELRAENGSSAPVKNFSAWHNVLLQTLTIAPAFAKFLSDQAKVLVYNEPPAQVGVRFEAPMRLSEMIDRERIASIPGTPESRSFPGYLIATQSGEAASDAVSDLLRGVADHAMHLHGYESEFERFRLNRDGNLGE